MKRLAENLMDIIYPMADRCPVCSAEASFGVCGKCADKLNELKICDRGVYAYNGTVRGIIHRYKFEGKRYLCDTMAEFMLPCVTGADIITNVPVHKKRRRERGYDQSRLLAMRLSGLCGIPYEQLIEKTVNTRPQSSLAPEERWKNAEGKYAVISRNVQGKVILLIDDVITTGATMAECSRVLLEAGAAEVKVLSFAKTVPTLKD